MSTPKPGHHAAQGKAASAASPSPADRWWTLGIVTLSTFMLMLDLTVVNVALPSLRTSLHGGFSDLQWVIDAYALSLAVFLLTSGTLADRLGRKRVFLFGFAVFTAASLACGLAGDILVLNIARGVQGAGAAVLFAVGPALIGQEFRGKERGTAFGVFGGGAGLAIAFGPIIGGALTDGLSWRWIFLVNVPIGVLAMALGARRMHESHARGARRVKDIDWAGLVTFSVAMSLLVLGLVRGAQDGWGSARILTMFVVSALALAVFMVIQRARGANAMLDLSLFRVVSFNGIGVAAVFVSATAMSSIFLLVSYIQNTFEYSPWQTGVRFLPMTLMLFLTAAVGGALSTKVPQRLVVGLALTLVAVGLGLIRPLVDPGSAWTAALPGMMVLGFGLGLFNPARAFLSIGVVEPRKAGMASGMNETFQQVGMAIGIAAFGALFRSRVADRFAHSDVGRQIGASAHAKGEAVAAGGARQVADAAPAGFSDQVAHAGRVAFVDSLGDVLSIAAVIAAVGAVLAFALIRGKDLHPSAVGAAPGVLPDPDENAAGVGIGADTAEGDRGTGVLPVGGTIGAGA
ncbi:MFS transporter [Embleya scabrispora]|uniref:MFS transporter n=1 Tax=Embleya scabrispora TaxID=159449 RepID=UPI00039F90CC|nr:MFS transporter [Embleya scabrispora]MYS84626.1 DHA2 family efflux MFS transporter permease subunit [Streptomyces sp. SID5474]